ncbi:MAG: ferrous iron transporter B [Flavobacteriia bacterium]
MKIALLGNPNTGKSSLFNMLTGMRQHVGNFPGVTVDKNFGILRIGEEDHTIIDLPGTYSLYPRSRDEQVVYDVLSNKDHADYPDVAVVVADQSNLKRNLFLFTQIYDLKIPTVLVLNMSDIASRKGIQIDTDALNQAFPSAKIVVTTAKIGIGKERLINAISDAKDGKCEYCFIENSFICPIDDLACQEKEADNRYKSIESLITKVQSYKIIQEKPKVQALDKILVHPIWGYLIFALVLMVIFQFIFSFSSYPMDFIESTFTELSSLLSATLPKGIFADLLTQGIVPGIGGVVVFIPQIALLFFFIALLEESGYLARVVFMMDRLMRPLGLNGKSVVPLLSSAACAIPGIMATRTIADWKERMITILVAPIISCSARIPVFTLLISLVIPKQTIFGFLNLQGLVLFALYALGVVSALLVAVVLKMVLKSKDKGYLLLELPSYKAPLWKNVGLTVLSKIKVFVVDAGKVILAISIILWLLATYGPSNRMALAEKQINRQAAQSHWSDQEHGQKLAALKLENSYIGIMGKGIQPFIEPLGYDWKIGISLITSFAAREVFVGSLATIYAVNSDDGGNVRLIDRMRYEKRKDGKPVYSLASGVSLMVFYVYAMQCMATLAVVKRETKSWKWPIIQIGFMGALAYFGALITFNLLR